MNDQRTKGFFRYNPVVDKWTVLNDFPGAARGFAIGVEHQAVGYLGFGIDGSNYLNDFWKFDTASMSWTQLASCPCVGRIHPSMVAVNGFIYVGLGSDDQGDLKDWWKYDIANNTWTALPDLPGPGRHHPFQFAANGNVYAGLGHSGNTIFTDWYQLNTSTDTWQKMNDFPAEGRVAGTQFHFGHRGFILSGDGDNHSTMATGEFWEYNDSTDSWIQLTPHPGRSRCAPGSFIIKNDVYFFGGLDRFASVLSKKAYKFSLAGNVGLSEQDTESGLNLFPIPAKNHLFVTPHQASNKKRLLIVKDVNGKTVLSKALQGAGTQPIDIHFLPAGYYFLFLGKEVKRFIKE